MIIRTYILDGSCSHNKNRNEASIYVYASLIIRGHRTNSVSIDKHQIYENEKLPGTFFRNVAKNIFLSNEI